MICKKCGSEMPEGSQFCTNCGTQFTNEEEGPKKDYAAEVSAKANAVVEDFKNGDDKKKLIYIAGAAVVLLLLVLLFSTLFGASPKKAAKGYFKAVEDLDVEDMCKYTLEYNEKALEKLDIYDEDDYEKLMDELEESGDGMDEVDDYKFTYDIKEVEEFKDGDKEFKWVVFYLEEEMEADADAVKKVAFVKARTTISYVDEDDEKHSMKDTSEYVAVKVGSKWYMLDNCNADSVESYYKNKN